MLSDERKRQILMLVADLGSVTVDELQKRFPVSKMTLWRDLKDLAAEGNVRRVHGGVVSLSSANSGGPVIDGRLQQMTAEITHLEEKRRIAEFAAKEYLADDDVVILEGGTTILQMVQFIKRRNVTVLTHALGTLIEAAKRMPEIQVIACGGTLRQPSFTFVGPESVRFFEGVRANTLFISARAFDMTKGLCDPTPLEIQVKQAMIRSAERAVVCVDSSKIGLRSLSPVLPIDQMSVIITDANAPASFVDEMKRRGVELHVV